MSVFFKKKKLNIATCIKISVNFLSQIKGLCISLSWEGGEGVDYFMKDEILLAFLNVRELRILQENMGTMW